MSELKTEIKVDKKKRYIRNTGIIFITIIVLLTFFSKTINNYLLPEVESDTAFAGTVSNEITAQGEVVPLSTEFVNAYGNWSITDVKVKEGQQVKKGDVLAEINASDVSIEIKKMELNLLKMQNELKLYKNNYQSIDLDQMKDDLDAASKAVKRAEKNLEDQKTLFAGDAVAEVSVRDAQDQLDAAKKDYEQKKKQLSKKQSESSKDGEDFKTTLAEKEAAIAVSRLELENMKKNTPANGKIVSPVGGIIKSAAVEKGGTATNGQRLFEIIKEQSGVCIKWTLGSKAAAMADKDSKISFTVTEPERLDFAGTIIDKKYVAKDGVYEYTADITDNSDKLQTGQKVGVSISKTSQPYKIIVPNSSLTTYNGKFCVFVLKEKNGIMGKEYYAQKAEVTVLETGDFNSAISGDILSEDKIVTFSSKPLSDNMQVKMR